MSFYGYNAKNVLKETIVIRGGKKRFIFLISLAVIPLTFIEAQVNSSVKEILEKNIQALGGKEKISQVKSYSFKIGSTTYYLSALGEMKMASGTGEVVTEIILVTKEKVERNSFNKITEVTGVEKSLYQVLARLYSGFFTLRNFEDKIRFRGEKKFGPERFLHLQYPMDGFAVNFFLHPRDYLIRTISFEGFTAEGEKYQVIHDFGPYQDFEGWLFPSSWFSSKVGSRGVLREVDNLKFNPPLEENFFSSPDLNIGKVEVSPGSLTGNIIEFSMRGSNQLVIATNWTKEHLEKADFKNKDSLVLFIGSTEIPLTFFESPPSRSDLTQGAKLIAPNPQGENYLIFLFSLEFAELWKTLKTLLPIQIKKAGR